MDWTQVTITTKAEGIEPLCGILLQQGVTGFEIEDEADFRSFLENNRQQWDYVEDELFRRMSGAPRVRFYLQDTPEGGACLAAIREALSRVKAADTEDFWGELSISCAPVREEDWANGWKKYFKPIAVGKRILIKPEWEELPGPTDRIVFSVNPGMTFGTGSHESTRMCIAALEEHIRPGDRMLDLGCGSGILSVISLLLGAGRATAVDIDPACVPVATENARKNGVDPARYFVFSGNILEDETVKRKIGDGYDVAVANIVADVICPLAADIGRYLRPGGIFICSGIIDFREEDVRKALAQSGFTVVGAAREGEWVALTARLSA